MQHVAVKWITHKERRSRTHAQPPRPRAPQSPRRPPHPRLGPPRKTCKHPRASPSPAPPSTTAPPSLNGTAADSSAPNISPALAWTTPPAGTAELVLIVQDPDVPFGKPATHALTLGIDPSLDGIPENALTNPSPVPGIRHGKGALGHRGMGRAHADTVTRAPRLRLPALRRRPGPRPARQLHPR